MQSEGILYQNCKIKLLFGNSAKLHAVIAYLSHVPSTLCTRMHYLPRVILVFYFQLAFVIHHLTHSYIAREHIVAFCFLFIQKDLDTFHADIFTAFLCLFDKFEILNIFEYEIKIMFKKITVKKTHFIVLLSSIFQKILNNFFHLIYVSMGSLRTKIKEKNASTASRNSWYNWIISYIPEIF